MADQVIYPHSHDNPALREQYGLVPSSPPITTRLAQGSLALMAGTSVL